MDFRKIDAVFWDFDGVIKDTLEIKGEAFVEVYEYLSLESKNEILKYHYENGGLPRLKKFSYWNDKFSIENRTNKDLVLEQSMRYERIVLSKLIECPWNNGFDALVKKMTISGCKCFIISGAPRNELVEILGKYFENFIEVFGGNRAKTDHLKEVQEIYSLSLKDSIFIGDAESDYVAAKNMSIPFILKRHDKNSGFRPVNVLTEINSLNELL